MSLRLRHTTLLPKKTAGGQLAGFALLMLLLCGALAGLAGCANNLPAVPSKKPPGGGTLDDPASNLGARFSFLFSDYYTLTFPNSEGCAGDARVFYDPIRASSDGSAVAFALSNSGYETIRPRFIKNVAVDLTDANAASSANLANSCSYGISDTTTPPSSCATFDYGAIAGIPTGLGGTLLLLGGIQSTAYSANGSGTDDFTLSGTCGPMADANTLASPIGFNQCPLSFYALGVNTLPSAAAESGGSSLAPALNFTDQKISSWSNLSWESTYAGPKGAAGSAMAHEQQLRTLLLFGGSTPLSSSLIFGPGAPNNETWSYDLLKQKWTSINAQALTNTTISQMKDTSTGSTVYINKSSGGRANFGYAAVPGLNLSQATECSLQGNTCGIVDPNTNLDDVERIVILGGRIGTGAANDVLKFNPTFGPEVYDVTRRSGALQPLNSLVHWVDSYHTQLMNNSLPASLYEPIYGGGAARSMAIGMGAVGIRSSSNNGAGYILAAGGFDYNVAKITSTASGGVLTFLGREAKNETSTANYGFATNRITGGAVATSSWSQFAEGAAAADKIPWLGGVSLLPGFNLSTNDVVYFGGSSCREYLTDTTLSGCTFASAARYFRLGGDIPGLPLNAGNPDLTGMSRAFAAGAVYPDRAGMAAARGLDGTSHVIIVAWGGMIEPGKTTEENSDAGDNKSFYYLYNVGDDPANPSPKWVKVNPISSASPPQMGASAMVFSHLTRKFYLFGGYKPDGNPAFRNDIWELTVNGDCTAESCTFSWKQLSSATGLTCYPDCPAARRSHRMVEVNYKSPSLAGAVQDPLLINNACEKDQPCSFGIFMEGGTPDGFALLSDRWMFDPTANGGRGHWQRVDAFPPRRLAAMATVDYSLVGSQQTVHRAVMFGGETGLNSSPFVNPADTTFFLPPTLGDTYVYDFRTQDWHRVELLGKGYYDAPPSSLSEYERRQAYDVTRLRNTTTNIGTYLSATYRLTPPPTAGAMMITRAYNRAIKDLKVPPSPLPIPEVYMVGGRLKNGEYVPFSNVWKFCIGTTGEKSYSQTDINGNTSDDATCDSYDDTINPDSPNPTAAYVGRWLLKAPKNPKDSDGIDKFGSYLGAAAYDPYHDKILVYGGFTAATANKVVTDSDTRVISTDVFEYTFPVSNDPQYETAADTVKVYGEWKALKPCGVIPTARYGHTMAYDTLNNQLIVVGGYKADGSPLTEATNPGAGGTTSGTSFTIPEVWTAKRNDAGTCYDWQKIEVFGNSPSVLSQAPPQTGLGFAPGVYIPSAGYHTGFYSMNDRACVGAGPIAIDDPDVSKILVGGASIDLDRTMLGANENLLLHLTYLPMGETTQDPASTFLGSSEAAYFKIHLIYTGQNVGTLTSTYQPRHLAYSDTSQYPKIVQTLSVMAHPTGQIRQDQIVVPITTDSRIDRIRIERYSGSAILIEAKLFRLGQK